MRKPGRHVVEGIKSEVPNIGCCILNPQMPSSSESAEGSIDSAGLFIPCAPCEWILNVPSSRMGGGSVCVRACGPHFCGHCVLVECLCKTYDPHLQSLSVRYSLSMACSADTSQLKPRCRSRLLSALACFSSRAMQQACAHTHKIAYRSRDPKSMMPAEETVCRPILPVISDLRFKLA